MGEEAAAAGEALVVQLTTGALETTTVDAGSGAPCILLHGFPFDRRLWRRQILALAEDYRVVVPDLRGHGQSEAPPPPYRMVEFAEDVRALADRLELERFVLVGQSMGGYIALAFAERYPERIAGLGLVATKAVADDDATRQARFDAAAQARRGEVPELIDGLAAKLFAGGNLPADGEALVRAMMLGTSATGLAGSLEGMALRADTHHVLLALECPVSILAGGDDAIAPPAAARRMADAVRAADLSIAEGAGHLLPLEVPDATTQVLRRLMAQSEA